MNLKEIREIIDLVTEKGISEFELERSGVRIKISRGGAARSELLSAASAAAPAAAQVALGAPARSTLPSAASIAPPVGPGAPAGPEEEIFVVRSPMVGTFYSSPGQDATPFVRVGERVQAGQVLCIIEAMKLMNEIEAEVGGEIVKCYVENSQPVEFGEPLYDIRVTAAGRRRG